MPALPPGVTRRSGVYYLRVGIPEDLKHLYPPTRNGKPATDAFRGSLNTRDRTVAAILACSKRAEILQEFEDHRSKLRAEAAPPLVPINPGIASYVLAQVARAPLAADDVLRFHPGAMDVVLPLPTFLANPGTSLSPPAGGLADVQVRHLGDLASHIAGVWAKDLAAGRLDQSKAAAAAFVASLGIRVDWDSAEARPTLIAIMRASVKAWLATARRANGEPVETPPPPPLPDTERPAPVQVMTLRDVVPDWVALNHPKRNAEQRTERALKLFEEAVGTVPLERLDRVIGGKFVAFLRDAPARGFADSTAANHASAINALVNVAIKVGKLQTSPFDLSFSVKGAKRRERWTKEQLGTLFGSQLFREDPAQFQTIRSTDPTEAYWVLLMLLYSGARIGEIAQLEVGDFGRRDGIDAYEIHDRAGTVKTDESARWIPLHSDLVRLGVLEYVAAVKRTGQAKLFPSLNRGKETPASNATKWFAQYRTLLGLPPGALEGSHKFRHLVRSELEEHHIGPRIADALTGHSATGSTGQKVYTHVSLPAVARAVERLEWGLDLPRVWYGPPATHESRGRARGITL